MYMCGCSLAEIAHGAYAAHDFISNRNPSRPNRVRRGTVHNANDNNKYIKYIQYLLDSKSSRYTQKCIREHTTT